MKMKKDLLCIKIGGSVITDKSKLYVVRKEIISQLARILRDSDRPLLISHGVGSFAHPTAKLYGGMHGYKHTWGIAKVAYDVLTINKIIMDVFLAEKLPVISFSPRSFLLTKKAKLHKFFFDPIVEALRQGLIPVIFGDVIWDIDQNSTIFSGETTLMHLCQHLQKQQYSISRIIQITDVDGVLDSNKHIIPEITQKNWQQVQKAVTQANGADVTGGMLHKVEQALLLTQNGIETVIINGNNKRIVEKALIGKHVKGTVVR
jgi:isopentenyl phosphate kinase